MKERCQKSLFVFLSFLKTLIFQKGTLLHVYMKPNNFPEIFCKRDQDWRLINVIHVFHCASFKDDRCNDIDISIDNNEKKKIPFLCYWNLITFFYQKAVPNDLLATRYRSP